MTMTGKTKRRKYTSVSGQVMFVPLDSPLSMAKYINRKLGHFEGSENGSGFLPWDAADWIAEQFNYTVPEGPWRGRWCRNTEEFWECVKAYPFKAAPYTYCRPYHLEVF